MNIGAIVGTVLNAAVGDAIGRKRTLLAAACLYGISILTKAVAPTLFTLAVGRFVSGIGLTLAKITSMVYVCEICHSDLRGALGGCYLIFICLGGTGKRTNEGPFKMYAFSVCILIFQYSC